MFNTSSKVWPCYFKAEVRYRATPDEDNRAQRERRQKERAAIKAAGFDTEKHFKFRSDATPKQKSLAKAQATAYGKRITEASGVIVEIVEGSWL